MLCALTVRCVKPGAFDDWLNAWQLETTPPCWTRVHGSESIRHRRAAPPSSACLTSAVRSPACPRSCATRMVTYWNLRRFRITSTSSPSAVRNSSRCPANAGALALSSRRQRRMASDSSRSQPRAEPTQKRRGLHASASAAIRGGLLC
jgi:hypothetical protein